MKMKRLIAGLMSIAMLGMLTACGSDEESSDKETLIMATNAAFPPYEYYEDNKIVGIDAEIAKAVADELDMNLEIEDIEFGSIVAGVQSGKYDIGVAGITVTDERKESVNFTQSYATGIQVVIVKEDSKIKSVDDLSQKTTIGVQQDTTGDIYASEDFGENAVSRYNKGADAVEALKSGKVDCVIIDNEPAKSFVASNDGLKILDTEYAVEDYAICIGKDNDELLKKVNNALTKLKDNGTLQKIVDKYINSGE